MFKKTLYIFIIFSAFILIFWFIRNQYNNKELEKESKEKKQELIQECQIDSDCKDETEVVHCQTENRCENNKCVTYCVYNDNITNKNLVDISKCLDKNPLSVKEGEYRSQWKENNLIVDFDIVLPCKVENIDAYYTLEKDKVILNYEYKVPENIDRCLCVRNLIYTIPKLNSNNNYSIIINKEEK